MSKKERPFEVRTKSNGKSKSVFLFGKRHNKAAGRTSGGKIMSVRKVPIEKILGIGEYFTIKMFDADDKMFSGKEK